MTESSRRWLVLAPFLLAILFIGGHGIGLGLASHGDARAIFERSIPAILAGGYAPSRSYGVPLYELVAAGLYRQGGIGLVGLYSLALALGSLILFDGMLPASLDAARRAWLLAGFALSPLILINAATLFEWMQLVFLTLAIMVTVQGWLRQPSAAGYAATALLAAALILTRPDTAIQLACILAAGIVQPGRTMRERAAIAAALFCGGLMALCGYAALNGGLGFLHTNVLGGADFVHRAEHASVGVLIVLGPFGCAAVVAIMAGALRHRHVPGFFTALLLTAAPALCLRFLTLPTKLEFLIVLPPILLLAMAEHGSSRIASALVAVSLVYCSVVSLSVFARAPGEDRPHIHLALNPGGLVQDWDATLYQWDLLQPGFRYSLASAIFPDRHPPPTLTEDNYAAGLTTNDGALVLGADEAYKLDNPREQENFQRRRYTRIYICDHGMAWDNVGWRLLEPATSWPLPAADGTIAVSCAPELP